MIFLISWPLVGLLTIIIMALYDMRGAEFDENYFSEMSGDDIGMFMLLGYFMPLIFIGCCLFEWWEEYENKHLITKLFYNVANIGVKKDENSEIDN